MHIIKRNWRQLATVLFTCCMLVACDRSATTRTHILRATPPGTSIDAVVAYCMANDYLFTRSDDAGFLNQDTKRAVGVKMVKATVSEKKFFVTVTVVAFWGFDANGKLIDVWAWQTIDSL